MTEVLMLPVLLLASMLLPQDKPAKTVEERLKELDEKVAALEKKHKTLRDENAAMEKSIADVKAAKESFARQTAAAWVKQHAAALQATEAQKTELEALWLAWMREDQEKGGTPERWKAREEELRSKLSPEQAGLLARKVRDERQRNSMTMVVWLARIGKLDSEKSAALEKAVSARITIEEGPLLTQAHPQEMANAWAQTQLAVEGGLTEISATLTAEELQAMRKTLEQWKPKQR